MSLIKANAVQIGQSGTATDNFTLAVPSSPNGTIKLARGNAGATTQDVINVSNTGVVSFPQGFATSSITANVIGNLTGNVTGNVTGNTTGNLTGDVFASNGTSKILENGTNGTDATFTGSVSGGTLSGNASSATVIASGSTARSLANRFADILNVLDFGAYNDGTNAPATRLAIQSALDLGKPVYFPVGTYLIDQELVLKPGSKIIGAGTYSAFANSLGGQPAPLKDISVGTTYIKYDGILSTTACIIRASVEAVGIEPTDTNTRNLLNIGVTDVVLDGNGKAGIGLYVVRGLTNNQFDRITVTQTTAHAFLVMISFIGQVNNWVAYFNKGCGITIGKNVYSWVSANVTVDEVQFNSCFGYYNGWETTGANRISLNAFNETTGADKEYGIGFYTGRACIFINAQSAYNGGAGIYCETDRWPLKFSSCYIENNCKSTAADPVSKYGIWFNGVTGNASRHVTFDSVYFNGPSGSIDGIRLKGIAPSRTGEDAVVFNQIPVLRNVNADWSNYRLVDCDNDVVITGTKPVMVQPVLNASSTNQSQLNMGISGTANLSISGGAITSSRLTGVINSVEYTSTGTYTITFNQNLVVGQYNVIGTGSDNLVICLSSRAVGSCVITSYNTSGALADSSVVNLIIVGGYTL
jgi:hypothetical protein